MTARAVAEEILSFAGLSDRAVPVQLSRAESPSLSNIDFSGRAIERRGGYTRVHQLPLKNASVRLDGINDYLCIPYQTAYLPTGGAGLYVGCGVILRRFPPAATECTVWSKGFGVGNQGFARVTYDSAINGGLGGFRGRVWDNGAGISRTVTVNDGDGGVTGVNFYRYTEFYQSSVGVYTLRLLNEDGTVITSNTVAFTPGGAHSANTDDITLGVSMSAAGVIGTDFIDATLFEFRYFTGSVGNIALRLATLKNWAGAEIDDPSISLFAGYWKLNDGTADGIIRDSTAFANHGSAQQNPAAWTSNSVLGQSGLRFPGGNTFVYLKDTGGNMAAIFNDNTKRWTVRGTFAPTVPPGSTTIPDQAIFTAGNSATVPQPFWIRIVGDRFEAKYNDGGAVVTLLIDGTSTGGDFLVHTLPGTVFRWALSRYGTGNGSLKFEIVWDSNTLGLQALRWKSAALANALPTVVSTNLSVGRHLTSFAFPYTYAADGGALATIDDIQIVWTTSLVVGVVGAPAVGAGGNVYQAFGPITEIDDWSPLHSAHVVRMYMKMNEGGGNILAVRGYTGWTARLLPEENDGMRWDAGQVRPYRPPETTLLFDYKRFLTTGLPKRSLLAISGSTIYDINIAAGTATAIAAGLKQGGLFSASQYGQNVYLAAPNGDRPMVLHGDVLDYAGIRAPVSTPTVALGAGAGFNGAYYLYVTYRSSTTPNESGPSEGVLFTTAGAQQISSVQLPISSDPQVTERRIYVTLVGGGDGSVSYLAATVADNVTTNYTTPIVVAPTSGISLTQADGFRNRDEPPQASVLAVFRDRLFVGGNQVYPTRVWYSVVGSPGLFNQTTAGLYVDLDLDSGDPVTGMWRTEDFLFVSMRDGTARLWNTGDSNNPVGQDFLPVQHGAVGPQTVAAVDAQYFYITERDIYATNGQSERNVSSPENLPGPSTGTLSPRGYLKVADLPSIQTTMRTGLNPARRTHFGAATYRSKNQVLFPVSLAESNRNNATLVYDYVQSIWSKYDLPIDVIAEVENQNDDPRLYGAIEGYVCALDNGTFDGALTAGIILATSGPTLTVSTALGADNRLQGLKIIAYRGADNTIQTATIAANTNSTITTYGGSLGLAGFDLFVIGAIPMYIDFIVDFGDPFRDKKLKFIRVTGTSDNDWNLLRISYKLNNPGVAFPWTDIHESIKAWKSDSVYEMRLMGGLCRSVRFRISESGLPIAKSQSPVPQISGTMKIYSLSLEAEALGMEGGG